MENVQSHHQQTAPIISAKNFQQTPGGPFISPRKQFLDSLNALNKLLRKTSTSAQLTTWIHAFLKESHEQAYWETFSTIVGEMSDFHERVDMSSLSESILDNFRKLLGEFLGGVALKGMYGCSDEMTTGAISAFFKTM
jgi:hypothetical protein